MAHKVRLKWMSDDAGPITEECYLLSDSDTLYTTEGQPIAGFMSRLQENGMVIFEDEKGVFGLYPEQINLVEVIEEDVV